MSEHYARGPGHSSSPGPVPDAYADSGAIDRECPTCHVAAGAWCVNPISGTRRHSPCLGRLSEGESDV